MMAIVWIQGPRHAQNLTELRIAYSKQAALIPKCCSTLPYRSYSAHAPVKAPAGFLPDTLPTAKLQIITNSYCAGHFRILKVGNLLHKFYISLLCFTG
jgi:hypothetical protein